METKTHWRKGDKSDYLMSWDLEDELRATIVKVERKETKIRGKNEVCRVAYFKENLKPMIVNVTNGNVIEKALGTHLIQDWANINLQVIVFVQGGVRFGKDTVRALRIKVAQLPELKAGTKAYENAVKHIREGNDYSKIESIYVVTDEIKTQIETEINSHS